MKKVINGKLYNTDTAMEMGEYWNGLAASVFEYTIEALYRKKNGEYFLYGRGGARSSYARRVGDMWGWGEEIRPLTEGQAKEWAERNLTADEYIEIFGEPEE